MKKLFMWSALLMTGFAFYSCDDVVDNPAQAPTSVWNYQVSVKFADFAGIGATYQGPTTLYVLNEDLTPMGTITTETAPAAGTAATYAGTLTGAIGNNLIITTTDGKEFTKQDGTLASAVKYGIIQTAKVPIKIYNANTQKITTGAAKMENITGIAEFQYTGSAADEDKKITFSTDNLNIPGLEKKEFTITLDDAVTPRTGTFFVALGKDTDDAIELQFTADGEERGFILKGKDEAYNLDNGKVNAPKTLNMKIASTDLTKYWAIYKEAYPAATETDLYIFDDEMTINQSGEEAVPVIIRINSGAAKKATLKGINAKQLRIYGASYNEITLDGTNKVDCGTTNYGLWIDNAKATFKGTGSLETTGSYGIRVNGTYTDSESVDQPSELVIDKEVTINAASETGYGAYIEKKLTLKEGAKLFATSKLHGIFIDDYAQLETGEGVTIEATATGDGNYGIFTDSNTKVTIGKKSKITATGGKEGMGIYMRQSDWEIQDASKAEEKTIINATSGKDGYGIYITGGNGLVIGKYASVTAQGCPKVSDDAIGRGIYALANITLKEYASLTAIGCDREGLYLNNGWTLDIAEHATVTAEDHIGDAITARYFTVKGKGKLIAKVAGKRGINNTSNTFTIDGAEIETKGGEGYPAIIAASSMTITSNLVKLTATAGTGSTICISKSDAEAKIEDLVGAANKDKFNDTTAEGVRTITPKPAEE